ncbi:MAG: methylated-DNA--[protein]-cysteine S-methyltransferase [Acidimicrobiia bacterium]
MTWWRQATPFGAVLVELADTGAVARITMPGRVDAVALDAATARSRTRAAAAARPRVRRQLDAYFAGRRATFDVAVELDPTGLSAFQRHVLETLRAEVPYGETVTYGELAELAGRPGAARAVGTAMSLNPVPFVIPCHRVVAANGIGGYGGGTAGVALKRALLDLEARGRPTG